VKFFDPIHSQVIRFMPAILCFLRSVFRMSFRVTRGPYPTVRSRCEEILVHFLNSRY